MTFLPNPAYNPGTQANSISETSPGYMRNPVEMIVDITSLTGETAHYVYIDMDGYDCIALQVECTDGSGAGDVVTFTWEETIDPETDPTTAGVQWTANTIWSGSSTLSNSAAALDRIDSVTISSPVWYRLTYEDAGAAGNADLQVKIKRWKS